MEYALHEAPVLAASHAASVIVRIATLSHSLPTPPNRRNMHCGRDERRRDQEAEHRSEGFGVQDAQKDEDSGTEMGYAETFVGIFPRHPNSQSTELKRVRL